MYNILIAENNLKIIENIVNNVFYNIKSIKICNIASDHNTAKSIILSQRADIIILGIHFKNLKSFIEKNKISKYKKSIITLSNNNENLIQLIKNIINNNNYIIIKSKIKNESNYLNYNYSYIGTRYLEELIFEFYKIKDKYEGNFKNVLYPILSKKYNKSIDTIYGDIKQATNAMILDCKESKIIKYFNYDSFYKPKIKEIVFTITNKIS